jgi:hypothetical protein
MTVVQLLGNRRHSDLREWFDVLVAADTKPPELEEAMSDLDCTATAEDAA